MIKYKSIKERVNEMIIITEKLNNLGLYNHIESIDTLKKIMNNYIKNGEYINGEIDFYEAQRIIIYCFNPKLNNESTILMKNNKK